MTQGDAGGRSCLKTGCLVVVGCFGLGIMIVALVVGLAWMKAKASQPEPQVVSRAVPAAPPAPEPPATAEPRGDGPAAPPAGRVVLDLSDAEFRIEPGTPGEPIRIEAKYDRNNATLEESFEPGDGGAWTYTVRFDRDLGFLAKIFEGMAGNAPSVRVLIPPDVPIELDMNISEGEGHVRLGGLWLTDANLDFSMGGVDLRFDEPLRQPMEALSIKASMGGGAFFSLGNASPRRLDVEMHMGGMNLDLTGRWQRDAEIRINHSMGGASVQLPRDVIIEGIDHPRSGDSRTSKEIPLPVLRFSVSSEMGEVKFEGG